MDLYVVQYAIPARKPKTQNKPQKQTSKPNKKNLQQKTSNKQKQKQKQNNQKNTKKWDRYQQWKFMHGDILCVMMISRLFWDRWTFDLKAVHKQFVIAIKSGENYGFLNVLATGFTAVAPEKHAVLRESMFRLLGFNFRCRGDKVPPYCSST